MQDIIRKELNEASEVVSAFVADSKNIEHIEKAVVLLATAFKIGNKVISCGNGGSMCDAMHFAEELSGRFRSDRAALPAMAISDPSHITCTANDYGFESIFSRYVEGFGNKGDVLLAISTSGNSNNIIKAAEVARSKEMKVIALTGKDGGKLANICDVEIRVPHMGYADRIQEIHIKVIHCMILGVEKALFG
ncbi:MAG: D-sedoheptulose 7-phosphate isomerase [Bacteroidota bacterium]|jgi:D-sedoheptulose 7-phosphate isomerase